MTYKKFDLNLQEHEIIILKRYKNNFEEFKRNKNRMVNLQKMTLLKTSKFYEKHKNLLQSDYGINSYSAFINYCIREYLALNEKQIRYNLPLF